MRVGDIITALEPLRDVDCEPWVIVEGDSVHPALHFPAHQVTLGLVRPDLAGRAIAARAHIDGRPIRAPLPGGVLWSSDAPGIGIYDPDPDGAGARDLPVPSLSTFASFVGACEASKLGTPEWVGRGQNASGSHNVTAVFGKVATDINWRPLVGLGQDAGKGWFAELSESRSHPFVRFARPADLVAALDALAAP